MTSVQPPLRSTGCHACRKMKVKCDEQKPSCARCERAGRPCPGYRVLGDMIFRSMNASAENKSLKTRRRLNKANQAKAIVSAGSRSHSSDSQASGRCQSNAVLANRSWSGPSEDLGRPMPPDWDQQAICQFFEDYVIPVEVGRGGYLSFLPDLYRQHQDITYLSKALHAVSMASLANRTSMSHLVVRARRSYGEALTLINVALNDERLAKSDELLASLMLLTKYEHISGDKTTLWESHTAGQLQLIRLRGQDQFKSSTGLELYRLVLARHRLADLAYRRIPTLGSDIPSEGVYRNPHAARLADLMAGISALYGFLPKNGVSPLRRSSFPEDWVEKVLAIEEEIRQWSDTVPAFWGYRSMTPYDNSDKLAKDDGSFYPKAIHVYNGFVQASSWNIIWCGRIHLLHAMLASRSTLSPNEALRVALPSESSIKQELQMMADNVCNSVPFMLSEVDRTGALEPPGRGKAIGAYFLIWALHVAGSVEVLPRSQQDWIAGRLLYIGHVVGIQQALVLREFRTAQQRKGQVAPLSIGRMSAWQQLR